MSITQAVTLPEESHIIVLRDQSSSMRWVPGFPRFWNQNIVGLAPLFKRSRITLYSFAQEVTKIHDAISPLHLDRIPPESWQLGQMLQGGSSIEDALVRGCQKAKLIRKSGHEGLLVLFLITDGWSQKSTASLSEAREWLNYARGPLDVTFRMIGINNPMTKNHFQYLEEQLGLTPWQTTRLG